MRLAGQAESEVVEHVTQDALENAVSAFDAFGREVSRVAAPRSTDLRKAASISFQNINGARNNIQQLFNIDIAAPLTADEWKQVVKAFQKRHLIAHKMGIVDDGYLEATGDTSAVMGRKIKIDNSEAQELNRFLMLVGEHLTKVSESRQADRGGRPQEICVRKCSDLRPSGATKPLCPGGATVHIETVPPVRQGFAG